MAHVTVEYTGNLAAEFDLHGLLSMIAAHMREEASGVFPVGGIRVRAYRLDDYVIADGACLDDGFINVEVKMGAGRDPSFRQAYFNALFGRIRELLEPVFSRRPLALSMYVSEVEGWKHNSIHHRLEKGA